MIATIDFETTGFKAGEINRNTKQNTYNYGLQVNDSFDLGEVGAGVTGNGSSSG